MRGSYCIALPRSVTKASPEQLRPAACEERRAVRLVEAELRTKLLDFDEFSQLMMTSPPPGPQEILATGGRRITGKTTVSGEDPDQMRAEGQRVTYGDGKRPRVGNEAAPEDQMETTEDVDPEVQRRVNGCASPDTTSSTRRNRFSSPPSPFSGDVLHPCEWQRLAKISESER